MKILRVTWGNYRRLQNGEISVRDHLILIGPNDSGKSSILRAIHLCLGIPFSQLPSQIAIRDFTSLEAPLCFEVTLCDFTADDRAAFPDEISVTPAEVLRVAIEATVDPADGESVIVQRFFPDSGHRRSPSRLQLDAFGWAFVPAARSLYKELGATGGAVQSLLASLDLSADSDAITSAAQAYQDALDGSAAITGLREGLATALSSALPRPVPASGVQFRTTSEISQDPLAGVTVALQDGDHVAPLTEQSDGVRALSVLAVLGIAHHGRGILGVDEPETHLHTAAQRSISRSLRVGGQRVIVTHSAAIVGQMDPLDVVVMGADRRARQLPQGAAIAKTELTIRHWAHRLIDPLTARAVILVEGVADRIMFERIAVLSEFDLDRVGVVFFELDGADFFPMAYHLLGAPGFDIPLFGVVDADHQDHWAKTLDTTPGDLAASGYVVCDPDLEAVYVEALGCERMFAILTQSGLVSSPRLLASCEAHDVESVTAVALAQYCGHKKRKVHAASATAAALSVADVGQFIELRELLGRAVAAAAQL